MDIRYWILSLTTRCNLHCAYCYADAGARGMDMTEAVLEAALNRIARGAGPAHVQLTGGEPTLVPRLLEKAIRGLHTAKRPLTIGVQTNGTLLTPELMNLFNKNRVQVGVSLDGPPAIQESVRGLAAQTLRGLQLLETLQVPFRITTVVSEANATRLDRLLVLLAGFSSARGMGLDLLVEKGRAVQNQSACPAGPRELKAGIQKMLEVLKAVNRRRSIPLRLRELDLLRACLKKEKPSAFCHAQTGESLAVHPDGSLFPCGQTLGDPAFLMGHIEKPEPDHLRALCPNRIANPNCVTCPIQPFCPGDCPSRLHYNFPNDRHLACILYQTLWETGIGR